MFAYRYNKLFSLIIAGNLVNYLHLLHIFLFCIKGQFIILVLKFENNTV